MTATVEPLEQLTAAVDLPSASWVELHERVRRVLQKDLFFIVGCQKSGTTWLQHLLNAHPAIVCRGEGRYGPLVVPMLQQLVKNWNAQQTAGDDLNISSPQFDYLFVTFMGLAFSNAVGEQQVRCVGDKTPGHAMLAPLLLQVLPRAKFVHIIRDGRDGAVSGWVANRSRGSAEFAQRYPALADYVAYYVQNHWIPFINSARSVGQASPQQYFELRYEDLHVEPDVWTEQVLRFLGVDASAEIVARCRDQGAFERLSGGRQRGQEDGASHYRKGIIGDWKNHFDARCVEAFEQHGGALRAELGYAP